MLHALMVTAHASKPEDPGSKPGEVKSMTLSLTITNGLFVSSLGTQYRNVRKRGKISVGIVS